MARARQRGQRRLPRLSDLRPIPCGHTAPRTSSTKQSWSVSRFPARAHDGLIKRLACQSLHGKSAGIAVGTLVTATPITSWVQWWNAVVLTTIAGRRLMLKRAVQGNRTRPIGAQGWS